MFNQILRAAQRLDDHWIGDLLGSVSLFAAGYGGFLIGHWMGLQ